MRLFNAGDIMKNMAALLASLAAITVLPPSGLQAMGGQPELITELSESSQGSLIFYLQQQVAYDSLGRSRGEFSYSLAANQLQFISRGNSYQAGYSVAVIVFDSRGRQAAGDSWDRAIRMEDYQQLQKGDSILADTLLLPLPPGKYRVRVIIKDAHSAKTGQFERPLKVASQPADGHVTGVRFERDYNGQIIPWPSRVYGEGAGPPIISLSLPSLGRDTVAVSAALINHRTQREVWRRKQSFKRRPEIRTVLPVDSLADGNYRLILEQDDQGQVVWREEYMLMVQNQSLISQGDYLERIAQVECIARRAEFDSLRRAEPHQRDSLWQSFWKSRDPTPDTERNEYREAYYQKINYANLNYGNSIRPGWRTDRGRIYIKYGPPDEVEKHPLEIDSRPYEIWYYYQEGLRIVFADRHGFGDYRIVHSNREI
jgi:GWxTD domain-containing protein